MTVDLRAEVLKGIDRLSGKIKCEIPGLGGMGSLYKKGCPCLGCICRTALRHLREIVERHEGKMICIECQVDLPCPTLLSLAPDYAPQALK